MAGNGASRTRLTSGTGQFGDRRPAVSPDGTTLDGQNQRFVVSGSGGPSSSPVFSPDGAWLAFTKVQHGNNEVMVLKLGRPESEALTITSSDVLEFDVDWKRSSGGMSLSRRKLGVAGATPAPNLRRKGFSARLHDRRAHPKRRGRRRQRGG